DAPCHASSTVSQLIACFFFTCPPPPPISTLSLHDALPISYGTLAFAPARVHFAGHQLLVPLYVVALGAALLLLWQLVDGDERTRSEEHTSELQSRGHLVCRLLLEKKNAQPQARLTRDTARV